MKKKILVLLIYTGIVLFIAFLFRNHSQFSSALYFLTGVAFLISAGGLLSSTTQQKFHFKEEIEENKEEDKDISLLTIIMCLYIVVPFILAVYLFAN